MMPIFEHGLMEGKLYRFRPDCDECAMEAWERMTYGGVVVVPNPHGSIWWPRWLPPFVGQAQDGYTEDVIS